MSVSESLNPRQRAFANNVGRGLPLVEAYAEAGYRSTGITAKVSASRLADHPGVQAVIRDIQAASAALAAVEASEISGQLERIREAAMDAKQYGAAVNAVMGRAKLHGLIIDKAEVKDVTPPLAPEQRRAEIDRLLARRPYLSVVGA